MSAYEEYESESDSSEFEEGDEVYEIQYQQQQGGSWTGPTNRQQSQQYDEEQEDDAEEEANRDEDDKDGNATLESLEVVELEDEDDRDPNYERNEESNAMNVDEEDEEEIEELEGNTGTQKSSQQHWHRLIKDREHIEAGFKVVNRMTTNDVNTLLKKMQTKFSPLDPRPFFRREVNWENMAFGNFSAEDVRLAWTYLKLTTRTYRNLRELVDEVVLQYNNDRRKFRDKLLRMLPNHPKGRQIVSGFSTYVQHAWSLLSDEEKRGGEHATAYGYGNYIAFCNKIRATYDNLPPHEKATWEKLSKVKDSQRQEEIDKFYAQFPGMPLKGLLDGGQRPKMAAAYTPTFAGTSTTAIDNPPRLKPKHPSFPKSEYVASKIRKIEPRPPEEELPALRAKYAEKWKRLPNRTKAKWIDLFIQKCQQFLIDNREYKRRYPHAPVRLEMNITTKIIGKQGLKIWEEYHKKPIPPPATPRYLFRKLFVEQPQYKDLPRDVVNEKAFEKWDELSNDDKLIYKMHYVRLHQEYKKQIEAFWTSIPEVIKKATLASIPKKFRFSLTHLVEKVSDYVKEMDRDKPGPSEIITSEEYYQADEPNELDIEESQERPDDMEIEVVAVVVEDDDLDNEPLNKRMKPQAASSSSASVNIESSANKSAPRRRKLGRPPGRKTKHTPLYENPMQEYNAIRLQLSKAQRSCRRNTDDIIRGIFESLPVLGTSFSPLYYYTKYVAHEKFWMGKVFTLGVNDTANLIFESFKTLSQHQKEAFVKQARRFHQQMFANRDKIAPVHLHNKLTICPSRARRCPPGTPTTAAYFGNEPTPPPSSVETFYNMEYERQHKAKPERPYLWKQLDLKTQTYYMKQLYIANQKYVQDYDKFVQQLNPAELLGHVFELYKGWEQNCLKQDFKRRFAPSYLNPLPNVNAGDRGAEQQMRRKQVRTTGGDGDDAGTSSATGVDDDDSHPLDNDDYISWLTSLDPPKKTPLFPERVTAPRRSEKRHHLDSDEPDSDDERIGYRGGQRVGSGVKSRALTLLEKKRVNDAYEQALQEGLPGLERATEVEN